MTAPAERKEAVTSAFLTRNDYGQLWLVMRLCREGCRGGCSTRIVVFKDEGDAAAYAAANGISVR